MEVDICNIHQNGGLVQIPDTDDADEELTILQSYRDKTVIFMDDVFRFFDAGDKTAAQLCYPSWLHDLALTHSSSLFIGSTRSSNIKATMRRCIFPTPVLARTAADHIQESHVFESRDELVDALTQ